MLLLLHIYVHILDPKTIKIVWVLTAHSYIHTIKNYDMNFNRSPNDTQLQPPANSDNTCNTLSVSY